MNKNEWGELFGVVDRTKNFILVVWVMMNWMR